MVFIQSLHGHAIKNIGTINYNIGNSDKDEIYTSGYGRAISNEGVTTNNKATFLYNSNNSNRNYIYSTADSTTDCVVYNGSNGYMVYNPGANGKLESRITGNSVAKTLLNEGEFICSSGTIKSITTNTFITNATIYNNGMLKLCGTTIVESNNIGIATPLSSAISCIYNEAKIRTKKYGVTNQGGKVYIASNITIDSNGSIHLFNDSTSNFGPEISSEETFGIYVSDKGELTVGANESPVSVCKSFPVIKSANTYGINIDTNSKFYFYDGVIIGAKNNSSSISGNVTKIPENYKIETRVENNYRIVELK